MKKGWERKTLGEVCEVQRGSSPRPIQKYTTTSEDGVNWIKIGDTKNVNKYIFETREKITKEGALKSRYVKEGDFILSNSMSLGKPFIMKTDGYIHDGWFVLRLPDYLDKDYFYYLLTSDEVQNQFTNLSAGAIVKNISGDLVKKTLLPIPPLKEQEEIVSKLDKGFELIDRLKENAEKNLENAKELFQSALREELSPKKGWETKKLGEVCEKTKTINPLLEPNRLFKYIDVSSVDNKRFIVEDYNEILGKDAPSRARKQIQTGDVIFATVRPTLKRISIIEEEFNSQVCSTAYVVLRANNKINYKIIFYFLQLDSFIEQMEILQKGASYPAVTDSDVKNQLISFPADMKEQQTIVTKLDKIKAMCEELEENYKKSVLLCEELKQGLLREVFED